ncbi:MAG: FmdB family transcriptional regulator [Intrasporangium sp.]|nr:FmdB family zinc ribbon protein [Intrasporangium sp.]MDN5795340.1 FmdB family transcriptional regulator [Intrasporangium sp.]
MPTYSYACRSCDHAFDIRQSFSDDPLLMCPKCGELQLRKVIYPVGISFKGSGFYRTDSKSSAVSPAKPSSQPGSTSTESSTSSSSSESSGSTVAASSTAS